MHYTSQVTSCAACSRISFRPFHPLRSVQLRKCASVSPSVGLQPRYKGRLRASSDSGGDVFRDIRFKELPAKSRDAVLSAVEQLGNSATAAEVASKAALSVQEAEKCLQALAIDGSGSLKVTEAGDVIYTFPENVGAKLTQQDLYLQGEVAAKAASKVLERVARVSFGVVLVASIAFSTVAIAALAIAASSSDNNNRGGFSFGGGDSNREYNGGGGGGGGFFMWIDPWPMMYGNSSRRQRMPVEGEKDTRGLGGFFEDAFSIVFGGGSPNEGFDEERWRAVGERIAINGGVIAGELILPLLDLPEGSDLEDEAYMLPVLLRFNGTVDVVTLPGGDTAILYRFPELQRRAALPALAAAPSALAGQSPNGFRKAVGKATSWLQELQNRGAELERQKGKEEFVAYAGEQPYAEQKPWKLFDVSESNVAPLVLLVTLNGMLLAVLSSFTSDPIAMQLLRQSAGPGFASVVATVAPALCVYASLYALGPAFRYLQNQMRNSRIDQANSLRGRAAQALDVPSPALQSKLSRASRESQVVDISRAPIAYDTAQPADDSSQADARGKKDDSEYEIDDWDSRMRRRL